MPLECDYVCAVASVRRETRGNSKANFISTVSLDQSQAELELSQGESWWGGDIDNGQDPRGKASRDISRS